MVLNIIVMNVIVMMVLNVKSNGNDVECYIEYDGIECYMY